MWPIDDSYIEWDSVAEARDTIRLAIGSDLDSELVGESWALEPSAATADKTIERMAFAGICAMELAVLDEDDPSGKQQTTKSRTQHRTQKNCLQLASFCVQQCHPRCAGQN